MLRLVADATVKNAYAQPGAPVAHAAPRETEGEIVRNLPRRVADAVHGGDADPAHLNGNRTHLVRPEDRYPRRPFSNGRPTPDRIVIAVSHEDLDPNLGKRLKPAEKPHLSTHSTLFAIVEVSRQEDKRHIALQRGLHNLVERVERRVLKTGGNLL